MPIKAITFCICYATTSAAPIPVEREQGRELFSDTFFLIPSPPPASPAPGPPVWECPPQPYCTYLIITVLAKTIYYKPFPERRSTPSPPSPPSIPMPRHPPSPLSPPN